MKQPRTKRIKTTIVRTESKSQSQDRLDIFDDEPDTLVTQEELDQTAAEIASVATVPIKAKTKSVKRVKTVSSDGMVSLDKVPTEFSIKTKIRTISADRKTGERKTGEHKTGERKTSANNPKNLSLRQKILEWRRKNETPKRVSGADDDETPFAWKYPLIVNQSGNLNKIIKQINKDMFLPSKSDD